VSEIADLDNQITALETELAALYQCRRERDDQNLLLAVLQVRDDWFEASELRALVPLSPTLVAHLAGASAKAIGCRLKRIADGQDRSATIPALRLLRHKTTTAATVWKIETYLPACGLNGSGR
jgi:hypothetical protein